MQAAGVLVTLVSLARPSAALEPGARADEYTQTPWPAVPRGATVSAIVRSAGGALWVATSEGLLHLEGPRVVAYDASRVPGIAEHNISALLEEPDGALWVGSRERGLLRLRGDQRTTWQQRDGLPDNDVHALARGPDGSIWVGGGIGVARLAPGAARGQSLRNGLPRARVQALAVDPAGVAWAGTQAGLLRWDGTEWRPEPGPPAHTHVEALWADGDGTLWAGTGADGLWRRERGAWRVYSGSEGLGAAELSAILRDRAGHLWVGSRQGRLFWLDGDTFRELPLEHEPCGRSIEALAEDGEGGLWLGTTSCGLHRIEGRAVRLVGRRDGLPADMVLGLTGTGDGTVWVGTRGSGLARIAAGGRTVEAVGCAPGLPCTSCWDLAGGAGGGFTGVCRRRLVRWDGHTVLEAPLPEGWAAADLVMEASDGALWLARGKTVVRWKDGQAVSIAEQEELAGKRVLQEGRGGAVWIAAYNGVALWRAGRVQVFRSPLPGIEATSLCEDGDGVLWVGTKGAGLRRLRDGAFATITTAGGLPTNWIIQILEDDAGRLWMSGSKGLFSAGRRELEQVAAGVRPTLHPSIYDAADGVLIRTESFGHPAGWKGKDGRLWFATHDGIAIVEPASLRDHPPPRVLFDEVRVGDRRFGAGEALSVPGRGARDLEAHFVAASFAAPDTIAFRHRLLPMESDWIDAGASRSVYYPRLEPGRYVLQIQARHRDGAWGVQEAAASFELRPPFYRSPWFIAAVAAAAAALLLLAHRLRLAQARAGLHAVMAERARIARDMHDTLAQAFVATSVRLECLDHALESEDRATARKHLDTARRVVRDSLEEARRSVWVLRPQALERGLPAALETLVGGTQGETRVELEVMGTPRPLAPAIETNLLRIAQEAVANAYRHARAHRIILRLAFAAGSVLLSVTDDGTGITAGASGVAQGLTGMRERAAEIGGTLSIEGAAAGGTAVRVEVPA
jgi:signal transduction histidine kinase/ligand-binding sensor domain-containing protein